MGRRHFPLDQSWSAIILMPVRADSLIHESETRECYMPAGHSVSLYNCQLAYKCLSWISCLLIQVLCDASVLKPCGVIGRPRLTGGTRRRSELKMSLNPTPSLPPKFWKLIVAERHEQSHESPYERLLQTVQVRVFSSCY